MTIKKTGKIFLLCFALFLLKTAAFADSEGVQVPVMLLSDSFLKLSGEDENFQNRYFYYFADTSGELKAEQIVSSEFSGRFVPLPLDSEGNVLDTAIMKSRAFWLRLAMKNVSVKEFEWWFDCAGLGMTEFFMKGKSGITGSKTGFRLPLHERDIKIGEKYILNVRVPFDTLTEVFFRIGYDKASALFIPVLANKNEILEEDRRERYIQGAFFGLLVIIALYNLLLYFFVKEISNIYYAFYLICVTISYLATSGYGFELFWPRHPGNFIWIITVGWALAGLFYVLFGRAYLNTRQFVPKWNRILNIHVVGSVIAIVFIIISIVYLSSKGMIGGNNVSVYEDSSFAGILAGIGVLLTVFWIFIAFFIVLIPAYFCWKKKFQPAKYFMYASVSLAGGNILGIFGSSENIISGNAFQFGMAFQAVFFSLGLGYRINLLQEEKQKAQENALLELEEKVRERTSEVVKQKEIVEDKQKEIIDSIVYAKRLQEAILPPKEIIKKCFPDSFVMYIPKDIVAGDFYWMDVHSASQGAGKNDTEIIFIAAADCTGHGVPGAMVSVVCSNALNRAVKEFGILDTGKILDKVTDLVLETFSAYDKPGGQENNSSAVVKDGMDISLLKVEFSVSASGKAVSGVQWSGANNPLWFMQKKSGLAGEDPIQIIKADKQPIGKFDLRKPFTTHHIVPAPLPSGGVGGGFTFYLFTDGLADQFGGPKKKKFMYKRLKENISAIHNLSLTEQEKALTVAFKDWKGTIDQVDDITVIGIRV